MEEKPIHEKLTELQSILKVPKNQFNKFGGYSFRSAEDIVENVKPHLKELGLSLTITDEVVDITADTKEPRIYVKAKAILTNSINGSQILCNGYAREPEHRKGMDAAQITGASSSYARKYALQGLLLLDDNKDPDATNKHDTEPNKSSKFEPSKKQEGEIKKIMSLPIMKKHISDMKKVWKTIKSNKQCVNFIKEIKEIRDNELEKGAK